MAKPRNYTKEQLAFLEEGYRRMAVRDLAPLFNARFDTAKSEATLRAVLTNHGIKCGRKGSDRLIKHDHLCTPEQELWLQENYKSYMPCYLTVLFNSVFGTHLRRQQIECFLKNHRIDSGRSGRFEKGHVPANKGTNKYWRPNSGNWQKGHMPCSTKSPGFERFDPDYGYIMVRIPEPLIYPAGKIYFRPKHVLNWEAAHGPVPEGMIVAFKNGDSMNCDESNLMLISRAELLKLNGHHYKDWPDELKPSLLALAKLETAAHVRTYPLKCGRKKRAA